MEAKAAFVLAWNLKIRPARVGCFARDGGELACRSVCENPAADR